MTAPGRLLVLASCALLGSCFELPVLELRDAARMDAARVETVEDRPLRVVRVTVLDARGEVWPVEAAPRALSLVIEMSAPVALGDAEPVVLVSGEPDEVLAVDAERAPLTAATRERVIAADVRVDGTEVRVTPRAPLGPGAVATLVMAAWIETREGRRIDAASLVRVAVSTEPTAGAAVIATFPADGTVGVPTNAAPFVLALDGDVELVGEPIRGTIDGAEMPGVSALPRCSSLGLPGVVCVAWAPSPLLRPGAVLVVSTTDALRDAAGALVPRASMRVRLGDGPDLEAPRVEAPSGCLLDERATEAGCVIATDRTWAIAVRVAEPARIELTLPGQVLRALAPRGVAELVATDLEPGLVATGTLTAVDLAGLRTSVPIELATHAELAALTITEVCADPEGPEPAQEWIEIANFGRGAVTLEGIALSDRGDELGTLIHTTVVLPAGARAVIAAEGFDADAAGLPPGAPLVTVGRALVSGGLSNAGEALFLRDTSGRRLARVPALPGREGQCLVRAADASPRADAPEDFHYDACSPGS